MCDCLCCVLPLQIEMLRTAGMQTVFGDAAAGAVPDAADCTSSTDSSSTTKDVLFGGLHALSKLSTDRWHRSTHRH